MFGIGVFSGSAFAASWYSPASSVTTVLNSVDASGRTALAVGNSGKIIRSTNYGSTWSAITPIVTTRLNSVDMEGAHAVAVGDSGVILYSSDSGATWTAATSGSGAVLYGVSMGTIGTAFAVGASGTILKSTDWGVTWTTSASGSTASLRGIVTWNSTTAYAVGTLGTILSYNGTSWSAQSFGMSTTLLSVSMASMTSIWVGGYDGVVRKSTDGTTWSGVTISGLGTWDDVNGISMNTGSSSGSLVATNDGAYETSDGGTTWSRAATGTWTGTTWLSVKNFSTNRLAVSYGGTVRRYDGMAPSEFTTVAYNGIAHTSGSMYTPTAVQVMTWGAVTDESGGDVLYSVSIDSGTWVSTDALTYTTAALGGGSHTVALRAVDDYGTYNTTVTQTIVVDSTAPTVGAFTPTSATTLRTTLFSVTATDDKSGMASCYFDNDGTHLVTLTDDDGDGTFTGGHTFDIAESFDATVSCYDNAGNRGVTSSILFVVAVADTAGPTVGAVLDSIAATNVVSWFHFSATDASGIDSCTVIIQQGTVAATGFHAAVSAYASPSATYNAGSGLYDASYTFTEPGDFSAYARCLDTFGNTGYSDTVMFAVNSATEAADDSVVDETTDTDEGTDEPATEALTDSAGDATAGSLIKLACGEGADVNDPCKAVYFYALADSKRHAFPNEKVFFTWYNNFDDVAVVSADFMSSLTLGRNVTYRPGTRMVKFVTVNTVYAVTRGGVLRAIDSEATASVVYGSDWNRQIDDISDAFFGNYTFGSVVTNAQDYDKDEEESAVATIDADME